MKHHLKWVAFTFVFLLAVAPGLAGDEISFSGSFHWERPDGEEFDGELSAVFTPEKDGEWAVAFEFDWEGEPHVFLGSASGSLSGELSGKAASDDPGHPLKFEFKGAFSDGTFSGTHGYFNREGDLVDSGTLELAQAG